MQYTIDQPVTTVFRAAQPQASVQRLQKPLQLLKSQAQSDYHHYQKISDTLPDQSNPEHSGIVNV